MTTQNETNLARAPWGQHLVLDFNGCPKELLEDKENIKGEFVAVIDRQTSKNQDFDNIDLYSKELKKMTTKFSLTDIVEIVHKFTKINKNKIYKWLLKLRK